MRSVRIDPMFGATRAFRRRPLDALRRQEGTSAIEFGIIAAVMAVCLTSVVDLANLMQQNIRLREVVRAGGLFAQTYPDDPSGISAAVTAAASGWNNISVSTPTNYCQCWNTATNAYTSIACDNTCGSGTTKVGFVSITASRPYTPMFLTGLTNTLTATHVVRYQ